MPLERADRSRGALFSFRYLAFAALLAAACAGQDSSQKVQPSEPMTAALMPAATTARQGSRALPTKFLRDEVLVKMVDGRPLVHKRLKSTSHLATRGKGHKTVRWVRAQLVAGADPVEAVKELRAAAGVVTAQLLYTYDHDVTPTDPGYASQWAHPKTQAPAAWDVFTGDPSVIVAVIGTGVQYAHTDLDANMWSNPNEVAGNGIDDDNNGYVDDIRGWDFANNDANPAPSSDAHETQVAGVIGAEANNGVGGVGVLWNTKIMNLRVSYTSEDVAEAITYAVDNGAKIINMSFGNYDPTKYGPDTIVEDAMEYAVAHDVVLIATAGNDNIATPRFPAAHPLVLCVGSTASNDTRSTFSNYGDWVDVAAPGTSIYTTTMGGGYATVSGTSFAAPYVSAIAAGLRSLHPTWSQETIRQVIEYGGTKIATDQYIGATRVNTAQLWSAAGMPTVFARIKRPFTNATVNGPADVFGTAIGSSYTLELRPVGGATWTTVSTGGATIDGTLGVIDLTSYTQGTYELRLTTTDGTTTDTDTAVLWRDEALPGWPLNSSASGPVAVGDIDGNPGFEVVWCTGGGGLYAANSNGQMLPGFPAVTPGTLLYGTPALGDVDGDGDIEIVATSYGTTTTLGKVMVYNHDGTPLPGWPKSIGQVWNSPLLVDLNGDGKPEVIAIEHNGIVHAWHGSGAYVSGFPVALASTNARNSPLAADMDGDGVPEIVVSTYTQLYVIKSNGSIASGFPVSIATSSNSEIVIADIDGDGAKDIVVPRYDRISAYRANGTLTPGWSSSLATGVTRRPSAADLDGDGKAEIVIGSDTGSVYVLGSNGSPLPGWPISVGADVRRFAINDVDGDGMLDIVATVDNNHVYAWHLNATPVATFPRDLGGGVATAAPVLGDIDGSGTLDLVSASYNLHRIWAMTLPGADNPFFSQWSSSRHDPYNTGLHTKKINLTADAHGLRVTLTWPAAEATSAVKQYAVYRNLELIGTTTGTTFDDPSPQYGSSVSYGVVGLDETKNVRVQSIQVNATATGATGGCTQWPNGTCSDNSVCTTGESCDSDLYCGGGTTISCSDGNICTTDSCDPVTGCAFTPNSASCDDGDVCTTGDTCAGGGCQAGTPISCDDGNPCTDDSCNPATGCVHTPNTNACNDGNACTTGEVCSAGTCQGGAPVVCNDGNVCTTDACNPATGCVATANNNSCNDNNACTTGDTCSGGSCQGGSPLSCDDGDPCTSDGCSAGSGCTHTLLTTPFFDSSLQVQHCCGATCSVGTSSRSPRVAEPNAPNTLMDGCADGTSSSQPEHAVRSVAISGTIARNASVTFQVGYQCKENSDWIEVYYASSAQSPTWALIDKVRCSGAGTFTSNFVKMLANQGGDHAVRAQLRHIGTKYTQAMCPASTYDDHDDVAFRVP